MNGYVDTAKLFKSKEHRDYNTASLEALKRHSQMPKNLRNSPLKREIYSTAKKEKLPSEFQSLDESLMTNQLLNIQVHPAGISPSESSVIKQRMNKSSESLKKGVEYYDSS